MIKNKYALQRLRRNKLKKKKKQFEITVIHVFTACILAIALFAFTSTEAKVNFGLGSISKIDSIVIVWPNLMHQKIENLQANQLLKIDYNSELAVLKNEKAVSVK